MRRIKKNLEDFGDTIMYDELYDFLTRWLVAFVSDEFDAEVIDYDSATKDGREILKIKLLKNGKTYTVNIRFSIKVYGTISYAKSLEEK